MKIAICTTTVLLLAVLVLFPVIDQAGAAPGGDVRLNLRVHFRENGSGRLEFFIGSGAPEGLSEISHPPESVANYSDKNVMRLVSAMVKNGNTNETLFTSLLHNKAALELSNTELSIRDEGGYFCFRFVTDFQFAGAALVREYRYLSLLHDYENEFEEQDGIGIISSTYAREREMIKVKVDIRIETDDSLSMTLSPFSLSHIRDTKGEKASYETDAMRFVKGSNNVRVSASKLLAPFPLLVSLLVLLMAGYGLLGLIWWKRRFRGLGLILPGISIIMSVFLVLSFIFPGLTWYSLGGITLWIYGGIFLVLVGSCFFIHPGARLEDYEDERKRNHFRMPRVVYIDRKIFIEKKGKGHEEHLDPYEVLELDKGASVEEIERSYRSMVRMYHPDKYMNSPDRIRKAAEKEMERLNAAYEALRKMPGE